MLPLDFQDNCFLRLGAELALLTERYQDADLLIQEGLALAEAIGYHFKYNAMLLTKGELALCRHATTTARECFQAAYDDACANSFSLQKALALFGLARVAEQEGDLVSARRLGWESQHQLSGLTSEHAARVAQWLAALSVSHSTSKTSPG
jgi:hypothetical protein